MPRSPQILLIDPKENHRSVVKRFIHQSQPEASLIEIDSIEALTNNNALAWKDYDLLILDNQLGENNGIHWVQQNKQLAEFPPVIFLSSMDNPDSPQAKASMDQGLELGAEGFLFKKQIDSKKFHEFIISALKKRQDNIENCGRVTEFEAAAPAADAGAMQDTFHQMQHAKALLHGHDDWPFPVRDLLAGKAVFAGYEFSSYMGRRNGIYSFKGNRVGGEERLALKLIDTSVTKGQPLPERLKGDLESLMGLNHPNLVKWLDYKTVDGHLLIVQELMKGQRLSHRLERTGVTEDQAIKYTLQILSALQCLHENSLNAGEISPENLLFKDNDTLVLTHLNNIYFDLSELDTSMTTHVYKDTLYLSPEIIQGLKTDHRSDLYSLGTICFHMLAGDPPFHGKTSQDVLTEHVSSPTPKLPNKNHIMNRVLDIMLKKTPSQRYQTAAEIHQTITRLYNLQTD